MTATLRVLDVYPMYTQTDAVIAYFRESFATALQYKAPKDDPDCLIEAQVLPGDLKKNKLYLYFHFDRESRSRKQYPILSAHLKYRRRPSGPVPPLLKKLQGDGRTIEWVERTAVKVGDPVFFVEAEVELPSDERPGPRLVPPVTIGGSTLKRCGEEYSAERATVGQVESFRWKETRPGMVNVWLSYSHTNVEQVASIWDDEERRCRSLLQQFV